MLIVLWKFELQMIERGIHFVVWFLAIMIALWNFVQSCDNHPNTNPEDFKDGWIFMNRMQDKTDMEWTILTSSFKKYWMLLVFQIICSKLIVREKSKVLFYSIYGFFSLFAVIGMTTTFVFVLYIAGMYLTHLTGKKCLCYIFTMCSLFFLHNSSFYNVKDILELKETESFLFDVGLAWLMAKSLSFAVDRIDTSFHRSAFSFSDISIILAYCLYLPAFFTGPIISYERFCEQMLKRGTTLPVSSKDFVLHVIYLFYQMSFYFVYEFSLHYVYSSSVSYYPEFVSTFDRWSLCGLGYALPMMFHLKYYVIYGVAGSIAKLEDLTLPPPPKCISCIHISSFLWRHFDRGLYLWLLRYLYHPLMNGKLNMLRRVYALSVSFSFVCLWHGADLAICVWSTLNCILVASEIITKYLSTTEIGIKFEKMPDLVKKRFCAVFATPHFIMMCISCTFFLSNLDIGVLLFKRMLLSGIIPVGTLAVVMYCGCHVSMDSKQWQGENTVSFYCILRKDKL